MTEESRYEEGAPSGSKESRSNEIDKDVIRKATGTVKQESNGSEGIRYDARRLQEPSTLEAAGEAALRLQKPIALEAASEAALRWQEPTALQSTSNAALRSYDSTLLATASEAAMRLYKSPLTESLSALSLRTHGPSLYGMAGETASTMGKSAILDSFSGVALAMKTPLGLAKAIEPLRLTMAGQAAITAKSLESTVRIADDIAKSFGAIQARSSFGAVAEAFRDSLTHLAPLLKTDRVLQIVSEHQALDLSPVLKSSDWVDDWDRIWRQTQSLWGTHSVPAPVDSIKLHGLLDISRTLIENIASRTNPTSPFLSASQESRLGQTFTGFSKAYEDLVRSGEAARRIPADILRLSPIEVFTSTDLLETVVLPAPEVLRATERESSRQEIREELTDRLEVLLHELNPELVGMWRGALFARDSVLNPDRVRHVTVSLRELLTQVIHRLAPDEQVKGWTQDSKDYHNGRPTRTARLRFICRGVDQGAFHGFVTKDVASISEFIDLFQRGTHETGQPFTSDQLAVLVIKAEATLRLLLEMGLGTYVH